MTRHLSAEYWVQVRFDLLSAPFEAQVAALGLANAALQDPAFEIVARLALYQAVTAIFATHGHRAARYLIDSSLVCDWRPLVRDAPVLYSIRHYVASDLVDQLHAAVHRSGRREA